MPTFESNGATLFYEVTGEGAPIIFTHGASWNHFHQYKTEAFSMISRDNWNRVWSTVTPMESKNHLHKVKCPTLLLIGDHDNMTNYQQTYIHEHIPNSELKVIANAHQGTNLDNPDSVNKAILEYIKKIM